MRAQQVEVDEKQIHLGVANSLSNAERCCVYPVSARLYRREAICQSQAAIAVAVPVELNIFAARLDDLVAHEAHERTHTLRSGVAHGVGETETPRTTIDCGGLQRLEGRSIGARGVFRYEHHRKTLFDGVADSFLGGPQQTIDGPVFRVESDGRRTNKRRGLNRNSGTLRDTDYRFNIGYYGSRSAVDIDWQFVVGDFNCQRHRIISGAPACAGQPDIGGLYAERNHEIQDLYFVFDIRVAD